MEVTVKPEAQKKSKTKIENRKQKKPLFKFKSIRTKILLGFGLVIALVIAMAIGITLSSRQIEKNASIMVDFETPLMIADERAAYSVTSRAYNVRSYLATGDTAYKNNVADNTASAMPYFDRIGEMSASDTAMDLVETHKEWSNELINNVIAVYDNGNPELASENMEALAPTTAAMIEELSGASLEREVIIEQAGQDVISVVDSSMILTIIGALLVIVLSIIIAIITAGSITTPIKNVMNRMDLVRRGKLKNPYLEILSQDETGQLSESTNIMQDRLKELVTSISEVSDSLSYNTKELFETSSEVVSGTDQVAMTMQELSEGSENQANTASRLSTIMNDFSKKVDLTTDNGKDIKTLSNKVKEETNNGQVMMASSETQMMKINDIVKQSVEKVDKLDAQTQEISKLVEIIQNVADQTNLLALNAAIEAARAGEHGKGFAVVADEVRKLAEQVDVSVSEITGFVQTIQTESKSVSDSLQEGYSEVQNGTSQIKATGETFKQISKSLDVVVTSVDIINSNLTEIKTNTHDMTASIEEVASVSEESAAGVEQTSAATQQISSSMEEIAGDGGKISQIVELSKSLDKWIQVFTI
ncbi:methyl-accepting chemotaxis protein [Marinilactibacillus sp. GCM10026970]|uniref:methyl-accepting chemotaxis protein n=1 Tax=Marinilactibacillus sp. GCM10026970 TaxID=3252642 RepID=UPI0036073270